MRSFNQALLAKQAWRLLDTPESLCARLLKAKYYPSGQLLDMVFSGNGSSVGKGILHGVYLLKRGVIWRVGNRDNIRNWRDPWIPRPSTFRPISPKGNCCLTRVADFLDEHGAWRSQLLLEYFWPTDVMEILKICTP